MSDMIDLLPNVPDAGVEVDLLPGVPDYEMGNIEALGSGLARGGLGLGAAVGTGLRYLGTKFDQRDLEMLGQSVEDYWLAKKENFAAYGTAATDVLEDPSEALTSSTWWLSQLGEVAPSLLASVVPGVGAASAAQKVAQTYKLARLGAASRGIGAAVGGATGGALEGTSTYRETYDRVVEMGGTPEEAAGAAETAAEAMTAASGVLNAIAVDRFVAGVGGLRGRTIKGLTEAITEWAEGPAEAAIQYQGDVISPEEAMAKIGDEVAVMPPAFVLGFLLGGGSPRPTEDQAAQPEQVADLPLPEQIAEVSQTYVPSNEVAADQPIEQVEIPTDQVRMEVDPTTIAEALSPGINAPIPTEMEIIEGRSKGEQARRERKGLVDLEATQAFIGPSFDEIVNPLRMLNEKLDVELGDGDKPADVLRPETERQGGPIQSLDRFTAEPGRPAEVGPPAGIGARAPQQPTRAEQMLTGAPPRQFEHPLERGNAQALRVDQGQVPQGRGIGARLQDQGGQDRELTAPQGGQAAGQVSPQVGGGARGDVFRARQLAEAAGVMPTQVGADVTVEGGRKAWAVGDTVKAGFVDGLTVRAEIPGAGKQRQTGYLLSRKGKQYVFVPRQGLTEVSPAEARHIIEESARRTVAKMAPSAAPRPIAAAPQAAPTEDEMRKMLREFGLTDEQVEEEMKAARVFHGSPHVFDKFSSEKIGTGEGAQAYGHGLYFAESQDVAGQYRQDLVKRMGRKDDDGASYDVEIEDEALANMLDWDAPISEQPDVVKQAADNLLSGKMELERSYLKDVRADGGVEAEKLAKAMLSGSEAERLDTDKAAENWKRLAKLSTNVDHNRMYDVTDWSPDRLRYRPISEWTGETFYEWMVDLGGSKSEASDLLSRLGIKGIRYLDAGSRTNREGTRNIVLFDDNLATIVAVNGKPVKPVSFARRDSEKKPEKAWAEKKAEKAGEKSQPKPTEKAKPAKRSREVEDLAAGVEKALGRKIPEGMLSDANISDEQRELLREFGNAVGKRVVGFTNANPEIINFDGAQMSGRLYVNADAKSPALTLAGHELLHQIRKDNPELYAKTKEWLSPLMRGGKQYGRWLESVQEQEGSGKPSDDTIVEELIAEFFGDSLTDPAFWERMKAHDANTFVRVARMVKRLLAQWIGKLKSRGSYQYITDLQKAHDVVARALSQYVQGRGAGSATKSETDVVMAARVRGSALGSAARADNFRKWFGASKVVDEAGNPKVVYHGSQRPDRIGDRFRKSRATSGPMAFFTEDSAIASSYSVNKSDTSYEQPEDYSGWFKYVPDGSRSGVNIDSAWHFMSGDEKRLVKERYNKVTVTDSETGEFLDKPVILEGDTAVASMDHWDYIMRTEARGNPLRAMVEVWLNSGKLFGEEERFMQLLSAAGVDMKRVSYENPAASYSAVYPVYLSIKNPLDTAKIPEEVVRELKAVGSRKRAKKLGADQWDKRSVSGLEWIERFEEDHRSGTTHTWTSIPDWVTDVLKRHGYDGIKDTGGKYAEVEPHAVWVPFYENQIKSALGNKGTFNPDKDSILMARSGEAKVQWTAGRENWDLSLRGEKPSVPDRADHYAASINTGKVTWGAAEVLHQVAGMKDVRAGIDRARRGTRSWEETQEAATRLASSVGVTKEIMDRQIGSTLNAEEMYAIRDMVEKSAERLGRLARGAINSESMEDLAAFAIGLKEHAALQSRYSGYATEAGRALNILRSKSSGVRAIEEALGEEIKLARAGEAIDPAELKQRMADIIDSAGGRERLLRIAKMIESLERQAKGDKAELATKVSVLARKTETTTWVDWIQEVWINGLLSGIRTQMTNLLSNTLVQGWLGGELYLAAAIGRAVGRDHSVTFAEANAYRAGALGALRAASEAAKVAFQTEEASTVQSKIDVRDFRAIMASKMEMPGLLRALGLTEGQWKGFLSRNEARINKTGRVIRTPGRALLAGDEFFKTVARAGAKAQLAMRIAIEEGYERQGAVARAAEIEAHPSEEFLRQVDAWADYATFTNKMGELGTRYQQMTIEHPWLRIITPFIKTPVNIVKFGAERLPFGLLMPSVREDLSGANGPLAQQLAYTRMIAGSSVAAGVAMMALEGAVTGGGPDDPKEKAVWYAAGWQPYSIKIGDTYYAYGRLEPLGIILGMAADFAEISQRYYLDDVSAGDIAHMTTAAVANNLTNKTFLSGLSTLVQAWNDPERYGKDYLQGLVGTLIPTLVSDVTRQADPELKEINGFMDKLRSRFPGASTALYPRRDLFGDPIELGGSAPNLPGSSMVSPIYRSEAVDDPVVNMMLEIQAAPGKPGRRIEGVDLEPEEYDAYAMMAGRIARENTERLLLSRGWSRLSNESKRDRVLEAFRDARADARAKVMAQYDGLRLRIRERQLLEKQRKQG